MGNKSYIFLHCKKREYISSAYILIWKKDYNCTHRYLNNVNDFQLKTGNKQQEGVCSSLLFKDKKGKCQSYLYQSFPPTPSTNISGYFKCKDGSFDDEVMMNDLASDCLLSASDEAMYKDILINNAHLTCVDSGQLPCKHGHQKCYNMTDICIYKLNICHALKMMHVWQRPHMVIPSVAPNMMHSGTNRKVQ